MNLKQLSELLGLSQTTVSRALNGYPEVAESTRARVQQAAREHGYRPNLRARGLATGRTFAVAHVVATADLEATGHPALGDALAGAAAAWAAAGYDMILTPLPDDPKAAAEACRELAQRGSVDGAVLHLPRARDPRIAALAGARLPFVVQGRSLQDDPDSYTWADLDQGLVARLHARKLSELGHTRIAFLNGPETLGAFAFRNHGFSRVARNRGFDPDPALTVATETSEAAGFEAAGALLDGAAPPTAFAVASLPQALGVQRACRARGLSIGGDVSIVAHDDGLSMFGGADAPPLFAGTRSTARAIGEKAATMLLSRLATPDAPPEKHLVAPRDHTGPSAGPPPG